MTENYQPGDRVALVCTDDPYTKLRLGDEGTVTRWDPQLCQLSIKWDSGSTLAMLLDMGDEVRKVGKVRSSSILAAQNTRSGT